MNFSDKKGYMLMVMPAHLSSDVMEQIKNNFSTVAKDKEKEFILDMEKVPNLYSSGINLITYFYKEIMNIKGKLYIVNVNETVESCLRANKLDTIVPIYSSILDFELEKAVNNELQKEEEL